jgi:hypothetical protein
LSLFESRKVKVSCTYDRGLAWERRFYAVKGFWGNDRARAGVAEDERGQWKRVMLEGFMFRVGGWRMGLD